MAFAYLSCLAKHTVMSSNAHSAVSVNGCVALKVFISERKAKEAMVTSTCGKAIPNYLLRA